MAAPAQAPTATTDPVERRLARRSACPQLDAEKVGSPASSLPASSSKAHRPPSAAPNQRGTSAELAAPEAGPLCASSSEAHGPPSAAPNERGTSAELAAPEAGPLCASSSEAITINPIPAPIPNPQSPTPEHRTRANRANARLSTGPRTESGKQRSSLNALRHGLTAQTAVLPTEDPEAYQGHIQQFLDEYAPANATETQLVHEIANTAWRLNRIPFLEAELLSQDPNPQSLIPQLCHSWPARLAPLPPVPKSYRAAPRNPGSAKGAARTAEQTGNLPAPHSVLREFLKTSAAAWSAAISTKWPSSSYAISAKDLPGIPRAFQGNLASFFQKNKSSATHNASFI
jgi:hypothetical protein